MLDQIRAACVVGRIKWRKHALERMMERGISRQQVKLALMEGAVIDAYGDDRPFPSLLVDYRLADAVLHVVVAFDKVTRDCFVITAYRPDSEHFEKDLKTRRAS